MIGEAQPVPERYRSCVGTWETFGTSLTIYPEGSIKYDSKNGAQPLKMEMPILDWSDQGFHSGIKIFSKEFKISEPPHPVNGRWEMVVNGERLVRVAP